MYIFRNALKNIVRNRGRNILMGAIIFATILTTVVSLIINNTAGNVIENYKDRFASEVTIAADMQKVMEEAQKNATTDANGRSMVRMMRPDIPAELLLEFTSSEYLKESIATGQLPANSDDITAIDQDDSSDSSDSNSVTTQGGFTTAVSIAGGMGNFKLFGDYWQDFKDGLRSLKDDGVSAMPQADYECVISDELAAENGIEVGDVINFTATLSMDFDNTLDEYSGLEDGDIITINDTEYTVTDSFMGGRATREVIIEMKVTGIYLDLTDEYANENMPEMAALNRRNEVMTTLGTLLAERKTDETGVQVDVKYYLKNPGLLSQFEAEVREKGLSDMFTVSTDSDAYNRVVKPVVGMRSISITFMLVVVILGAIILILLSSISIRERKYEIGVLRAMGMEKLKVGLGLMTEILIVTCVCLVIGLGVGTVVAQPVSDVLLDAQVEASDEEENGSLSGLTSSGGMVMRSAGMSMGPGMTIGGINSNVEPLSEMEITIGIDTIIEIILIAILLAVLSGLISISKITKYEPIKILMERN